jgi:hypothetical protein
MMAMSAITRVRRRRSPNSGSDQRRLPFLDAPVHPREQGSMSGESLFEFLARRMIARLPEDKRAAAWRAWKNSKRSRDE